MPQISAILSLPYIQPGQAQKHVTHNEALRRLDALVQPVVADRDRTDPPSDPVIGARHVVATGGGGAWAAHDGEIAVWDGGEWHFERPLPGWRAYCAAEAVELSFETEGWRAPSERPLRARHLGINAGASDTNRLTLSAEATLLTHEGGDHRLKINRASAGDTASLLFQTGYAGGAEMGLAGGADFSIKTSADGGGWTTALRLSAVDGRASGAAVQSDPLDATEGRLLPVGGFGLGTAAAPQIADPDAALVGGVYALQLPGPGAPVGTTGAGVSTVAAQAPGEVAQRLCEPGIGRVWRRARSGGVWQGWRRQIGQADLLGPVSFEAGLPGGAVFERADTATGRYLRCADGTQIAWVEGALFAQVSADRLEHVWSFPAPFAVTPQVSATLPGTKADYAGLSPGDLGGLMQEGGSASAALRMPRCVGAAAFGAGAHVAGVRLIAVGRWTPD